MASSIKSTALEPTRHELANASLPERLKRYAAVYGLVILAVALALLFSVLLPETFPTMINLRSIIGDKAIIAILSLAVMLPMVTGKIDLTVGYGIVLWHILAISLQTKYGFPWPIAVLTVLALGAGVGFLWFNAPPAQIFMGDTGSLALGGLLGATAVAVKHEIVLAIIGGLFVMEALSVIVQVTSFKLTGKRVFRMAPIHHHFEQLGWSEPQIVMRFWIVAFVLAMVGLATLKLR